jgi:hypothetical protein
MQTKHAFVFTFVLIIAWAGCLFAYVSGPDPAMNGIFGSGQTCNGCHTGNPVNVPGGILSISGLPTDTGWTAGQTYPLTVSITRPGQRVFGFQLSAVSDVTNQQAGTLTPGNARSKIICGGGTPSRSTVQVNCSTAGAIQYAEHGDARVVTNAYIVNWTAPSSASFGTVRFNLAGNAGNGDLTDQGDFIYTRADRVGPAAAAPPPPPPPPDLSTRAFMIVDRGGVSVITDGNGNQTVGYSLIQPDNGNTAPAGVAIFGFRQNNVLVTEAGVPASPLFTNARIYAEVSGPVNTGVAFANPTNQTANISFRFTDLQGNDFGAGSLTLDANQQIATFLNQDPFNVLAGKSSFQGTFSFTSDIGISVIALRGFSNERTPSDFIITTLPVTNVLAPAVPGTVYLPHFADGGGWTTQIVLVNPTDATITGSAQFFGQGGANAGGIPVALTANGQTATTFPYSIPGRSSFKLVTAGLAAATSAGSVRVTPANGAVAPSSLVIFSYKPAGITLTEAGAPSTKGNAFRMYAEETATGGVGSIQTGFAIANLDPGATTATLELSNLDGTPAAQPASMPLPGNGQVALFLDQVFANLSFPFQGVLRISGGTPAGFSVVGLRTRTNERGDFLITTTPPTNENDSPSSTELLFPHLANGGGYTTQFILFSGAAGQSSSGDLRLLKQDGSPFNLTVN